MLRNLGSLSRAWLTMNARDKYYLETERDAVEDYARHRIAWLREDQALIKRPTSGIFRAYIAKLGTHLVLVGDCNTCVFFNHSSDSFKVLVQWVAGSSLDYLARKVHIGMDSYDIAWYRKRDILREDILEIVAEGDLSSRNRAVWQEALELYSDDPFEVLCDYIYNNIVETDVLDRLNTLGRVVAPRVIYAREACRTLVRLLDGPSNEKVL